MSRLCSIEGCGRKHAGHGFCLMHYKRVRKHGSPDYRWGGKVVGRSCVHCDRVVCAREMCMRHYQMWRNHGDPLYADKKKVDGYPVGTHLRRGYRMVTDVVGAYGASPATAETERTDRLSGTLNQAKGLRGHGRRRHWEHRKIAGALPGQIVHHIDGNPLNNTPENLHVFDNAQQHGEAHRSLDLIAFDLVRRGEVVFDRTAGVYRVPKNTEEDGLCP